MHVCGECAKFVIEPEDLPELHRVVVARLGEVAFVLDGPVVLRIVDRTDSDFPEEARSTK